MASGQRDALQDRVRDLQRQVHQLSARRPKERGVAATRSDVDALAISYAGRSATCLGHSKMCNRRWRASWR